VTTAIVTLASHARIEHLRRQEEWIAAVAPDAVRVVVQLDAEPDPVFGPGALHVPPGADGFRLAAGRNRGAAEALARGADLLVFLDVDCLPHPEMLPTYEAAARRETAGRSELLCGPVTYLPEGVIPASPANASAHLAPHAARPAPDAGVVQPATPADWDLFWSLSFACTAETWTGIGGFDERYEGYGGEDTDFAWRAREAGSNLHWVGGAHALHQYHATSKPPWQHLDDILRNGRLFASTWGRWPMLGWIEAFADAGAVEQVDGDWRRVPPER
jgi:N-acetylglucosaminyl-diphospho-decaprenol L-rhamnosyltransferase